MLIYAGKTGLARTVPPARWGRGLDSDFVQYIIAGLRRLLDAQIPIDVQLISGRRTYAEQARLFRSRPVAAHPGCSQHEYGYAIDVVGHLAPRSDILDRLLGAFIVFDYGEPDFASQIIAWAFRDYLYGRGKEDPNHWAYYSDEEWAMALQTAGYSCGTVSPGAPLVTFWEPCADSPAGWAFSCISTPYTPTWPIFQ